MALLYFDGVYEKLYKSDGGENEKYIDGYIEVKEKKKAGIMYYFKIILRTT